MSVSLDLHGGDWCYQNGERVAGKPQNINFWAIVIADLLIVSVYNHNNLYLKRVCKVG